MTPEQLAAVIAAAIKAAIAPLQEEIKQLRELTVDPLFDAGVHEDEKFYRAGACVNKSMGYWVCLRSTTQAPAESDDWRLIMGRGKRGPAGKDLTDELAALVERVEAIEGNE